MHRGQPNLDCSKPFYQHESSSAHYAIVMLTSTGRSNCSGPDVCVVLTLVTGNSCSLSAQQMLDSVSADRATYISAQLALPYVMIFREHDIASSAQRQQRHDSILPDCLHT